MPPVYTGPICSISLKVKMWKPGNGQRPGDIGSASLGRIRFNWAGVSYSVQVTLTYTLTRVRLSETTQTRASCSKRWVRILIHVTTRRENRAHFRDCQ